MVSLGDGMEGSNDYLLGLTDIFYILSNICITPFPSRSPFTDTLSMSSNKMPIIRRTVRPIIFSATMEPAIYVFTTIHISIWKYLYSITLFDRLHKCSIIKLIVTKLKNTFSLLFIMLKLSWIIAILFTIIVFPYSMFLSHIPLPIINTTFIVL